MSKFWVTISIGSKERHQLYQGHKSELMIGSETSELTVELVNVINELCTGKEFSDFECTK